MTDGTSQPMVFGDIHELLRKVNGESKPVYMWQSDKTKNEIKQEEPSKAPEKPDKDTGKRSAKVTKSGTEGETDEKESSNRPTRTAREEDKEPEVKSYHKPQPRKSKSPPQHTKSAGDKDEKAGKKDGVKRLSGTGFIPPSKSDLQSLIETFSYGNENGHRHMVFLPDEVYATLETVYGSNRISAILTALARTYIERNKEELRRLIATRINLLQ